MSSPASSQVREWLGLVAVVAAIACPFIALASGPPVEIAMWLAWLLAVAVLLWKGRDSLFGPILWYDLVRRARGGRQLLHRSVFGMALLVTFYLLYFERLRPDSVGALFSTAPMHGGQLQRFANDLFMRFMLVQFLVAWLVTPLLTAGALSEERERKTLDLLFTTDLTAREIVLGKLAGGVGFMVQLVLTGLPILTLLVLLGGISPEQVLAGFVLTLMLIVTATSASLAISADAKSTTAALLVSFLLALPLASCCVGWPLGILETSDIWIRVVLAVLASGLVSFLFLSIALGKVSTVESEVALAPTPPKTAASPVTPVLTPLDLSAPRPARPWRLPPIGKRPMLWKECYVEEVSSGSELAKLVKGLAMVLVIVLLITLPLQCHQALDHFLNDRDKDFHALAQGTITAVTILWLGSIMLLAAGTISREREGQTLDSLLAAPLDLEEILQAKFAGSLYLARWIGYCLAVVLLMGVATLALNLLSFVLLCAGIVVWSVFFICFGLWNSAQCATTTRAILFTAIGGMLIMVGPLVLAGPIAALLRSSGMGQWEAFLFHALSPAAAISVLAFPPSYNPKPHPQLSPTMGCWFFYLVAAKAMWNATRRRLAGDGTR